MRLLLIEDEPDIINFLKPCLEAESFIVDVADTGELGSFQARTNDYDIVILDNMLPKKDGEKICEEIRGAGKTMPILVLSVVNDYKEKTKLINAGADDYLTKPFFLPELIARLHALLRRPPLTENSIRVIGDITLNTHYHIVYKGDKEVYLTKKEFSLLEYLLKNQYIALTRAMIMEHVWDINADPFSNTIESHILSLRKKVDPENKFIRTIPGIGYRMSGR